MKDSTSNRSPPLFNSFSRSFQSNPIDIEHNRNITWNYWRLSKTTGNRRKVFLAFRLHFDWRKVGRGRGREERAADGGRDESGWEEKGKDQKGAEGAGEEGEGRQVVAIKSWTGPRRRKASVVAWVERGPVTSTISRFDRADRGKRRRRRRRKRAWWAAEAGSEGAGEGKKRGEVEEDEVGWKAASTTGSAYNF